MEHNQYVCASVIEYEGGGAGVMALHRGDLASCQRAMDATPGVTYTDDRRVVSASIEIIPAETFDAVMKDGITKSTN